jgi:flotillin
MEILFASGAVMVGIVIAVVLLILLFVLKAFIYIGRPNEVLVFSGRKQKMADGSDSGVREIRGEWAFQTPYFESMVGRMDLRTIPVNINVQGAYSQGGIALNVHAVANVKVSSQPVALKNAIERFLGRDPEEIRRVAKETLEGHLRGVLATLTPEEVNEDRLKFANALVEEAEADFLKLGMTLDTLKILNVSDEVRYLDSIGRQQIAAVIRDAEIAETTAVSDAKQVEANAHQRGEVAVQQARTTVIQRENALRQLKAEMEAEAKSEDERALAAAEQARAEAELELQEIRQKLETLRRQADRVLPAEAQQRAEEFKARGQAATIEENGRAMAEVLKMLTTTWLDAGKDAKDIFLIQQLEGVMQTVAERVKGLELDHVTLLDSGDGRALPQHLASYPRMVREILDELRASTGIDVTGTLAGRSNRIEGGAR